MPMLAADALSMFLKLKPSSTLVIGDVNDEEHVKQMQRAGIETTTIDLRQGADIVADYMDYNMPPQESIWCSHTLEHTRNPGIFLDKIYAELQDEGLLGITVPPPR